MADLESSLRTLVLQNADVVASIGNRFFWDNVPEGTSYPCVRAATISDRGTRTHSGTYGGKSLVQLDVWDDDKGGVNAAMEVIRAWLDNYSGGMGSSYNVTIQVSNVPGNWDGEARLYRRVMEVDILYFKTV